MWVWELKSNPLQEQPVVLTDELSLQPCVYFNFLKQKRTHHFLATLLPSISASLSIFVFVHLCLCFSLSLKSLDCFKAGTSITALHVSKKDKERLNNIIIPPKYILLSIKYLIYVQNLLSVS